MGIADMIEAGHVLRLKELVVQRLSGDQGPAKAVDRGTVHLSTTAVWAQPLDGGMGVEYEAGGINWLPEAVFAARFQSVEAMSFGHAMTLFKQGFRVKRRGWIDHVELSMRNFVSLGFLGVEDLVADDWQIVGTRRDT